ncbi:MAG: GTPase obg [Parcubacteria group bacterium GW2011_GWA2_47_8]|nr:MAG: GTPase obg [Parcubacteria group bacterium GW2011_GWA2_47_8]
MNLCSIPLDAIHNARQNYSHMALIDEITLYLESGTGGDGVVRWRHEKYIQHGGPFGGKGGKGGDVMFEAVADISYLRHYRTQNKFVAEHGQPGGTGIRTGKNGADLIIKLPVGSRVTEQHTKQTYDFVKAGERMTMLIGGDGGRGNHSYKTSTNRSPRQFQHGHPSQKGIFDIELALIADVGIIGLPNAGKTTLLNALTHATAKVGNYPFTTLEPNLGAIGPIIVADVPGLIEGAAQGKGLGDKFLRHISRTKLLVHCIGLDAGDPLQPLEPSKIREHYTIIRTELGAYEPSLLEKPEIIVLTKSDLVTKSQITAATKQLKKAGFSPDKSGTGKILIVSSQNKPSVAALKKAISQTLAKAN